MLTEHQREKQVSQQKLILSIDKITQKLLHNFEAELEVVSFDLEQREKLIDALRQSEIVSGPIEPKVKKKLIEDQETLEKNLQIKLEQIRKELIEHTEQTRDFKKYNLKNVR